MSGHVKPLRQLRDGEWHAHSLSCIEEHGGRRWKTTSSKRSAAEALDDVLVPEHLDVGLRLRCDPEGPARWPVPARWSVMDETTCMVDAARRT